MLISYSLRNTLRVEVGGSTVTTALGRLPKSTHPMHSFVPLGPADESLHATDHKSPTRVMSILNTTPDSFSDGGDVEVADIPKLQETIRSQIAAGATIIDIGGQSSRPNAPDVTAEEEIRRVLPAIEAIKSLPEAANVAISVDTYRAAVAEAAIMAGAHIINDISAGKLDSDMFATIARLGCTYVMMHMRGTPATMMSEENCTYAGDLIEEIATELADRADRAQEAGIRRWRMILDPGIGFSKTPEQNMEILRRLSEFRWTRLKLSSYPWLVGTSRKSFIGKVTGVQEPKARVWGTSATVTAAVQGGADIVRVHDVEEMATVVKMADAMYRIET